jgi:hypothetical protein
MMVKVNLFLLFFSVLTGCFSQTLSWSGYSAGTIGSVHTAGTAPNNMSAVVTKNNTNQGDGTPKFVATDPGSPCYTSGSLALNANTFIGISSADNANYTVTINFNPTANGTCNFATFTIKDLNSFENGGSFLDVLEISALDGNNNPINATVNNINTTAGQITSSIPAGVTRAVVGSVLKFVGHDDITETYPGANIRFSANCNLISVKVNPPTGVPLKSIRIKYRPGYGTSLTGYWNNSSPLRPAVQYISISNITLTPTGGCTPLPIELLSFSGQCKKREKHFNWSTASEHNNDFFTLEHSRNGSDFYPMQEIDGAGNSTSLLNYSTHFTEEDETFVYYRLKQTDTDGATSYSDVIYVSCGEFESDLMTVFPNPSNDLIVVNFNSSISEDDYLISITDMVGKSVLDRHIAAVKNGNTVLDVSSFSNGYYFLRLIDKNTGEQLDVVRFSKID